MVVAPRSRRVMRETSKKRVEWRNTKEFKDNGSKEREGGLRILDYTLINFFVRPTLIPYDWNVSRAIHHSVLHLHVATTPFCTEPLSSAPALAAGPAGWDNAFTVLIS